MLQQRLVMEDSSCVSSTWVRCSPLQDFESFQSVGYALCGGEIFRHQGKTAGILLGCGVPAWRRKTCACALSLNLWAHCFPSLVYYTSTVGSLVLVLVKLDTFCARQTVPHPGYSSNYASKMWREPTLSWIFLPCKMKFGFCSPKSLFKVHRIS